MDPDVTNTRKFDLEDRLIEFAVRILRFTEDVQPVCSGSHLSSQLIRCGTSPALNYGEAQSAESRSDFIHKLRIILKELRETRIAIKIILKTDRGNHEAASKSLIAECDELISIFMKSVRTAEINRSKEKMLPHEGR